MDRGVEMPKINQEEYEKIKLLPDYDWNWIAREKTGKILSFTNKPTKTDEVWKDKQTRLWFNYKDSQLFQFIQWEDEKPYEIAELIREYEIKELRLAPSGTVIVDSFDESEETEVKDIEELKSWFEDDKLYVGEYVKHKINQLDEPEILSTEEKPLYRALVKWHEFVEDEGDLTSNYWKFDTYDGDVFPSNLFSKYGRFLNEMSKEGWNNLGINDSNAEFVKVKE